MPEIASTISTCAFVTMRDRLRAAIHNPIAPLAMTRWLTKEPVPFSERFSGEEARIAVGDIWGNDLFDCAWFRFEGEVPEDACGSLVARIDLNGEVLIVDAEGRPIRSLTNVTSEFARCHGEPGKVEYPLSGAGKIELWGDAAFNDLFGGVQGDGRIVHAEICETRGDIRALYFDFEVLCDILDELAGDRVLCGKVAGALEKACGILDEFSCAAVTEARATLAPFFEASGKTDTLKIWAVGHAHLDLAWLWPIRETIRKGIRTFATALANRDLYPEHILGMSQPQLYAWIKEHDPAFYYRIKKGVEEGSIEIQGRFWVEPDCNVPSGESLVRQVLYGSRFFEDEFGFVPSQCWQPDVFGYNGQLPQILAKSGHDVFMTQKLSWNMVNRFPHHSFHWEGIDGTSILTHMLPEETYNGPAAPRSLRKIRDEYAERDVSGHALMCYGIGDGGAGPGIEHLERLRRLAAFETLPEVEICGTPRFFEEWKKDAERFPRWKGELYLEKHQGTLTTQALAKKNNRRCEIALRELEIVSVFAEALAGLAYPGQEIDEMWKEVLLYQFHDILPGSSIKRVYDESAPRYAIILGRIENLTGTAFHSLANHPQEGAGESTFSSLSNPRIDWIRHKGLWHQIQTPALGFATIPAAPSPVEGVLSATTTHLGNEILDVGFSEDGAITSLFDKRTGTELLPPGGRANLLPVIPDKGDAWDFDADIPNRNVWRFMDEIPSYPRLTGSSAKTDGPNAILDQTYRIGDSLIRQRIVLQAGSSLLRFETEVDWHEEAHMLKVVFPTAITAETARFEIPFGSLRRSTLETDSITRAQFEVPAHQWLDLSEPGRGLAMFNDCKYGFRVKNGIIEMTALRSVPHPGCAVITVDDTGTPGKQSEAEYGDLGRHTFRYAFQPHDGTLGEPELTSTARAFNAALRILPIKASAPWVETDNPAIELTCCKKADSGEGWILRFCNVSPHRENAAVKTILRFRDASESDLLEAGGTPCIAAEGVISLAFTAFEVKTIVLRP